MATEETIKLTVNIKDRIEPVEIQFDHSMTPAEIIEELQKQALVPKLENRTIGMVHGKNNMQPKVSIDKQGVKDGDSVLIVWDGQLARSLS